jgi:hypothetical protein
VSAVTAAEHGVARALAAAGELPCVLVYTGREGLTERGDEAVQGQTRLVRGGHE